MKFRSKKAFTLVEAAMVMALTGILAYTVGGFILSSMKIWLLISSRNSLTATARFSMNRMVSELKRVNRPESISLMNTAECQFTDVNLDPVDFKQSGTNLLRNDDVLASSLVTPEGLRFTYLDETGAPTGNHLAVCSIRVWLSLSTGDQVTTLESSARIRNLL